MESFKIDHKERTELANVFIASKLFPSDIKLIILAYAGLMRVTKKHVCWTIYNEPPFFYRCTSNGKKKSVEQTRYVYLCKKQKSRSARRDAQG
jgi:hypothetical protein